MRRPEKSWIHHLTLINLNIAIKKCMHTLNYASLSKDIQTVPNYHCGLIWPRHKLSGWSDLFTFCCHQPPVLLHLELSKSWSSTNPANPKQSLPHEMRQTLFWWDDWLLLRTDSTPLQPTFTSKELSEQYWHNPSLSRIRPDFLLLLC